ncbi:MAG: tetratricopeptide repeat protein [Xanthomonadaceae bacterium]|nr:tetratricopeptide repeat protein [Xanthomonadaceae bacterium]
MNEMLHQFHFLRPAWLLALILLPWLAWLGLRRGGAQLELSRLVDPELLPHLLHGPAGRRRLPAWLFLLGWTLAALALAGPTWSRVRQPLYASRAVQVVAMSLSQHMLARDMLPSRLDRARYKAHDLLASNRDGMNALIGYAGEAFVVAPLTSDAHSLDDLLDAMAPDTMPVDGNDAAAAIALGVKLIRDAGAGGGSLVLITDQADAAADAAARAARAAGVRVSVLGAGTEQGGPIPLPAGGFLHDANGHMVLAGRDDAALAELAAAGGGRYAAMTANQQDIHALHAELSTASATLASGQVGDAWQDRGPWLLLPLLLIVALGFRRGWLLLLPLVLLPLLPNTARAGTWQNLWQRPDQQAAQALRDGHPKQAQQLARDPAWRAAAAYRAGDYAAAAQVLQHVAGTDAAYNRGNALAKTQHYREAIKAYDEALKSDPANADAKANRQAVEDWLKQQKKQQKPSSGQQKQKGQQDQNKGRGDSSAGDQGNSGKPETPPQKPGQEGAKPSGPKNQNGQPQDQSGQDKSGKDKTGNSAGADQPRPQSAQQQAAQQAQTEQAQQALKRQMDKALAGKPGVPAGKAAPHELGAPSREDPASKLPADLQHALQRVPDDPGALLRRKFELEYQQRHGGVPSEDGQP